MSKKKLIIECNAQIEDLKKWIGGNEEELRNVDKNYKNFGERSNIKTHTRKKLTELRGRLYAEQQRLKILEDESNGEGQVKS